MIQAEVGGAARIDPGNGVQRPGFMIRDFSLVSNRGENIRISSFQGQSNLALVFPAHSDVMRDFLNDVEQHCREFSEQDTTVVAVVPYGPKELTLPIKELTLPIEDRVRRSWFSMTRRRPCIRLSGAMDENGRPVPLVYLTDRFGEIVSTYVASSHLMPPSVEEVLSTFDFVNQQCPECEPPEWPR
jgi:hypothetical protein